MNSTTDNILSGLTKQDCTIIEKSQLYSGYFKMESYKLRYRKFDGSMSNEIVREIFERGNAAAIIPFDPKTESVVLIEQFRVGAINSQHSPWLLEIAAGIVDKGEDSKHTVVRELAEETGLTCDDLTYVSTFLTSPGGTTEEIALYVGKVDASKAHGRHGLAAENEDIRVFAIPLDKAYQLVKEGTICNSIAIIAIQYLMLNRKELVAKWTN